MILSTFTLLSKFGAALWHCSLKLEQYQLNSLMLATQYSSLLHFFKAFLPVLLHPHLMIRAGCIWRLEGVVSSKLLAKHTAFAFVADLLRGQTYSLFLPCFDRCWLPFVRYVQVADLWRFYACFIFYKNNMSVLGGADIASACQVNPWFWNISINLVLSEQPYSISWSQMGTWLFWNTGLWTQSEFFNVCELFRPSLPLVCLLCQQQGESC